jgi:cobalt-zinc-cadmium efflux system protein
MQKPNKEPSHHIHEQQDNHQHANPLAFSFFLILIFAFVEFFGGMFTQSLALIGDAWHMFSDVLALGLAWFASAHAAKARSKNTQTNIEFTASVFNVLLMLAVVGWLVIEAIERLNSPRQITGGTVMVIALLGLIVNIIVARRLHKSEHAGDQSNLNHRAALLHVMGDLLGSIAALVAGAIIYFTGWLKADPILSLFISALLLVVTLKLAVDIWQARHGKPSTHDHKH